MPLASAFSLSVPAPGRSASPSGIGVNVGVDLKRDRKNCRVTSGGIVVIAKDVVVKP